MSEIKIIAQQLEAIRKRTNHILSKIDDKDWYTIPDGLATNAAWQVGHITISQYFNAVGCTTGFDRAYKEAFPIREYVELYSIGTKAATDGYSRAELMENMQAVHERVVPHVLSLSDDIMPEPTAVPHPAYKTKGEALHWSYQHEVWHLGQIAMLRRQLGVPLNFLPK